MAEDEPSTAAKRLRSMEMLAAPTVLYDFASSPHGGAWKPLIDHGGEPAITPRVHIFHSIVGSAAGAWSYFNNSTNLEATNIVHKSGFFWQCMSRQEQADANFKANAFAISSETEDNGHPDTDLWTSAQIDTLVWLALQDAKRYGILRRQCPAWDAEGFGYHRLFPNDWTNVPGKTCPGNIRVGQYKATVLPRIISGVLEDDMPLNDADKTWLEARMNDYMRQGVRFTDHGDNTVSGASNHLEKVREELSAFKEDVDTRLKAIEEAVSGMPTPTSNPVSFDG